MFATHLAHKKNLDFLLVDRSFGVLSDVAIYGLGRVFKILFKLLVSWDIPSGKNFSKSKCFKVKFIIFILIFIYIFIIFFKGSSL